MNHTLDVDGWWVVAHGHDATQEDGHVGDIAVGKDGVVLDSRNHVSRPLESLPSMSIRNERTDLQNVVGDVAKRADRVQVQRDARATHDVDCFVAALRFFQ